MLSLISAKETTFENLEVADCTRTAVAIISATHHDGNDIDPVQKEAGQLTVTFSDVYFRNNTASHQKTSAGAISAGKDVNVRISRCRFRENRGSQGGAVYFAGVSLLVGDSSFRKNSARNGGGAIFANSSRDGDPSEPRLSIARSNFSMNQALGNESCQHLYEQPVNRQDSLSIPCPAGGAIYASNWDSISIEDSLFSDNVAVATGGAMQLHRNRGLTIERCQFISNAVRQPSWSGPASLQRGGALSIFKDRDGSSTVVKDSAVVRNKAEHGGALHFVGHQGVSLRVTQCRFRHNRATSEGGAIVLRDVVTSTIEGSSFVNNSASDGGALFL